MKLTPIYYKPAFHILIISLKIAEAVSIDPAPLPATVTSSARSVLSVATFNVPSTAKGDPSLTSLGDTSKLFFNASPISLINNPSFLASNIDQV